MLNLHTFKICILTWLCVLPLDAIVFNSELTKVISVCAGEEFAGKISLTNNQDMPEVVNLNQADYRYNHLGESFFETPGTLVRSNAKWIDLPRQQVTVMPHETLDVFYTVRVPTDNQLHGSYASAILVESQSYASKAENAVAGSIGLNIKIRYAYQVVTTLGKPKALLKVIGKTLTKQDGDYRLDVDVANCGECYLYPKAILKLFNASGQVTYCYESQPTSIMPDNSVRFTLNLNDLDSKKCTGFLILDDGNDHFFGEKLTIETTSAADAE